MPIALLTALTMTAFAANSILARLALAGGMADPASFTAIRLASGALVLVLLAMRTSGAGLRVWTAGSGASAAALFVYAAGFSLSYLTLDTGLGALILFSMVQATMIGWAIVRGDRPVALEWAGLAVAFAAFVWLVSPGAGAPDPLAAGLMALAGLAWGIYSIRGRASADPLAATAGNFALALPLAALLVLASVTDLSISAGGIALAVASGAVASGLGYALWYRVLGLIRQTRAAIVQLTVPVIAALGGVVFAGEPLTFRMVLASTLILGGVALAISAKAKRASA